MTKLRDRFTRADLAAMLAFAAVWIYCLITVRYSSYFADEPSFIAIAARFVHGDRPVIDEWNLAQLSCLFLCLPYRIYVTLRGGTAGIVLCFRYMFLTLNAVFYWYMYSRLRAYKWIGLVASLLFGVYVPFGFFSCNFHTIAIRLLMIVCLILFSEKQRRLSLVLAGFLLACSVLYQPGFCLLYFAYCVPVCVRLIRRKKGKPFADDLACCFHVRTWLFLTLGVFLCSAVFFSWLFARCGVRDFFAFLPNMLTDPAFDISEEGNVRGFVFRKIATASKIYGPVCWAPALVLLALSVLYACGRFGEKRGAVRRILFGAGCVLWILSCVMPFLHTKTLHMDLLFTMYPVPMLWFGLVCFLLGGRKNKRFLFFWVVALLSSLCADFLSNITLSLGSPIAYIADLIFFTDLVRELHTERIDKKVKSTAQLRAQKKAKALDGFARAMSKSVCVCFAVWFAFVFLFANVFLPGPFMLHDPMFSYPVTCKDGPCRGIHYPEGYGRYYGAKLTDIDTILERQPKNLYICGAAPELYLYAQLPYATYSPITLQRTMDLVGRHVQYWKLHPERLPECIYVPFDDAYNQVPADESELAKKLDQIRSTFDPLCAYTLEMGQSGVILYVTRWSPDAAPANTP